ncbi:DUF1326 domain-containing protein [Halobacterium litoreum]|uniref:DUF1326 domain-containing protein n=1 Tax=Halobacterium litoreum TaxID=2039234 RepID=A0ABD5NB83_9EURY|nr:DUF1326 domain-containing protein [Halobacterium litoreum]UHH14669.1 DUF1326 domain-containing protein [Halobacterium litoreum]
MTEDWTIAGEYVECCNCEVPCQCLWFESPTDDVCNAGVFWNIEEGNYGDVSLDGLTGGVLLDQEGVLFEGGWDVVLVLDEAADEPQSEALQMIFSGEAGGLFGALRGLIDEVVDVVSLPFEYTSSDGHFEFEAGDAVSMAVDQRTGFHDEPGTAFPHPLMPPDQEAKLGKSSEWLVAFDDQFSWENPGNNAYFGEFEFGSA